jgi:hypothetical protein
VSLKHGWGGSCAGGHLYTIATDPPHLFSLLCLQNFAERRRDFPKSGNDKHLGMKIKKV